MNLKKSVGSIVAAVFLAGVLLLYMCTFQVKFTEVAIVKTWGKPADEPITTPGLKFKWPYPVQEAQLYDKRTRILLARRRFSPDSTPSGKFRRNRAASASLIRHSV